MERQGDRGIRGLNTMLMANLRIRQFDNLKNLKNLRNLKGLSASDGI